MSKTPAIHIGNIVNKSTRKELIKYVKAIFTAGSLTDQSPATIRHALSMFSECQTVKNVTINNCNFTDNKKES